MNKLYIIFTIILLSFGVNALTGWDYYRDITIDNTGNSNTLTDYQVLITLDTATLISAGKMQSDCDDIRFTKNDGTTLLNYWIEDGTCNTANTKIWVKVPSIPASSTYTIKMWYGNSGATSGSSIDDTFIFGDDFNDESLDTNKWNVEGNGLYTEDNGYIRVKSGTGSGWQSTILLHENVLTNNYIIHSKIRVTQFSNDAYKMGLVILTTSDDEICGGGTCIYTFSRQDKCSGVMTRWGDGTTISCSSIGISTDVWYDIVIEGFGTSTYPENWKSLANGNEYGTWSSDPHNVVNVGIKVQGNSPSLEMIVDYDYLFIREYTNPEPTTSVGSEQTPSTTNILPTIYLSGINETTYLHSYFNITFYAIDEENETLTLKAWLNNNLVYNNDTYINNTQITYSTGFLDEGSYNFTIVAIDSENGKDYDEILFDVKAYELTDYNYNNYQYEDEEYNYTLTLTYNYEIFNPNNVYLIYNSTIYTPNYYGNEDLCDLSDIFKGSVCNFVVNEGEINTWDYYLNLVGVREGLNLVYKMDIQKYLPNATYYIEFNYTSDEPTQYYIYDIYNNTIASGTLNITDVWQTFKYQANAISRIRFVGNSEIDNTYATIQYFYYKTKNITYYTPVKTNLITSNATTTNFEWYYDDSGSNESILTDTISLMWRSWLNDIETSDAKSNYWEGSNIEFITYLSIVLSLKNESGGYCNYDYELNNILLKRYFENDVESYSENTYVSRSIAKSGECDKYYIATETVDMGNKKASYLNSITINELAYSEYYIINNIRNNVSKSLAIWNYDVEECNTSYNKNLLSLELRKEENYDLDNGTIRTFLILYDDDGVVVEDGYFYNSPTSNQDLCLYGSYSNELTYDIDVEGSIYYKSENMSSERSYYLNNASYVGNVIDIDLFTIDTENTDNFLVTFNVKDEFGNNIEGAQVKILKLNESTNSYYTLTIVSTDVSGNAYAYLEVEKYYKFIIVYEGEVYYTSNPVQLYQNEYSFIIRLSGEGINPISFLEGVSYDCNVSDDETSVSCYVNDNTNKVLASRLIVYEQDMLMKEEVYNVLTYTSSAFYSYTIAENKTHSYYFYMNIDGYGWFLAKKGVFNDYKRDVFNGMFIIESIMIVMVLGLLSMRNPQLTIILTLFGLIVSYLFGFMSISYSFLISAIVIGIIVLWRLRK